MTDDLYLNSLPPEQQKIWGAFVDANMSGFMLYGGTALALRYGHRLSIDFDFFGAPLVTPGAIALRIPWLKENLDQEIQYEPNTYAVSVFSPGLEPKETVKLSFFGEMGFPTLDPPTIASNSIQIASVRDILATKLKAIFGRVEAKDYIDIAEILTQSGDPVSRLKDGLADFELMFPGGNAHLVLKSLCWFKSGDLSAVNQSTRELLQETVCAVKEIPPAKPVFNSSIGYDPSMEAN
ncbi:MAG: hypothetical protein GVY36_13245 [Verrucomicrobia bacterium]|jgi:hypothetical protein|nr:hypothetical protein [Verrucomicrobiota bacterium]